MPVRPAALTASFACALALAGLAPAQSGESRMLMIEEGDDGVRHVMHMSSPDASRIREPDYRRDDLPIFRRRLGLDDAQTETVGALLEAYLEDLQALLDEKLPQRRENGFVHFGPAGFGPGEDGTLGDTAGRLGEIVAGHFDGDRSGGLSEDVDIDGRTGEVSVGIQIGAGPGGGFTPPPGMDGEGGIEIAVMAGGDPDAGPVGGVFVGVSGPDGEELPEEIRAQLEAEAARIAEQIQAQIEAAQESGAFVMDDDSTPEERMARMQERMDAHAAALAEVEAGKAALTARFENEVKTTISGEQLERWPALDRALVRRKTLPLGRLDGERTDLIEITENFDEDAVGSAPVAERLREYEIALHGALERRNAYLPEANTRVDEAIQNQRIDRAYAALDRAARLRVAVRDVNDLYAEAIANALDEDRRDAFRQRVLEVSYPRVYQPALGLRAFEKARQLPDLDEETLLRILEVEQAYRAELDVANANLKRTIRQHQPEEPRRSIEELEAMMSGAEVDLAFGPGSSGKDPVQEAFRARRDLDERSMKLLYELLEPDQVARLPKLPSERRRKQTLVFPQSLPAPH